MTIPLTWNDPSFSGLTDSGAVEVQDGGTLSDYSSTADGPIATVLLDGSATLNEVRINSDEGVRIGGSGNITISNSYIETTGLAGDHADGIQAYAPGGSGNVTITNTTIVSHDQNATSGMFIADQYSGTFTFNNVVFEGGPYGLRIADDAGVDDYVSLNNVYFVGPFEYGAVLLQEVTANIHITAWNNVRYATIVNGVLVPGALIPPPWAVEGGAPAPSAPVETAATIVSGTTEVTLTGTAVANGIVTVFDGTTQVGATTANASGAWSLTTGALASGSHSFTSTATDSTGNVSVASAALAVTIPSTPSPPAAPTIASFSPDSGVAGDHITNDKTLTLTGTAVANSTVTVFDSTKLIGTATANGSGAWTFTTAALADGSHSFTATDTSSGATSAASTALAVTIDTVAPNAPVESAASIVSGTTEVKLTGTAEANSTVTVFDGTTQLGTTTTNASGAWSLTTGALASGSHSLTSKATDAAGNISVASAALAVTIPSTPTAAPTIASFSPDSGLVGDHTTNDNTLTLMGTAVADSTVTVFDGTKQLGTATVNGSGAWTFTTAALADGGHNFTATDTSSGVTSAASSALAVTVDTIAPSAPVLGGDSIVNTNHVLLSGTAEANSTITVYDGTTVVGTGTTGANGSWSVTTAALASGPTDLTATATDAAGNVSAISHSLDPVIPGSSSSAPTNLVTNGGFETGSFSGWTVGGNSGVIAAGPQTLVDNHAENGNFAANIGAVDGDATLSQAIQTTAGQSYTLTFWLANAEGGGPNDFTVKWNGATLLSLADAPAQGYTEYTFNVVGTAGTSQLLISGRNDPSYWSLDAISVTATDAPVATIASFSSDSGVLGDHITNDNTLTLSGTAVANSTVTVYDGTKQIGTATASAGGEWTFTTTALADGSHSFTATDTSSGTTSAASSALIVTVDTVAPNAPVETASLISGTTQVNLTGMAEANSTITVFDGKMELGTATANAKGAWTFTTTDLAVGNHPFTATDTDAAGNISVASAVANVVVNATNLVTNGGFETGGFSGWTVGGNSGVIAAGPQTSVDGHAESGKYAANIGAMGGDATLSQAIQTTAGQHYTVTFWLANAGGSGANDFTVKWNGTTLLSLTDAPAQGYTEYTFDVVGTSGTSQLLISGRNDPSYWSLDAISVTPDAAAPAAPAIASFDSGVVGDHITNDDTLTLTGTAAADSTVAVYDGTTKLGTTTASSSGSWDYITSILTDAKHTLTATATDASGHTSAASTALSVTVDTHAPAAPVLVNDSVVNTNHALLAGTAEANSIIAVYDGKTVVGTGTTDSSGDWSVTTAALSSGSHDFTATATDAAGNVSAMSQPLDPVIPASTLPAAPSAGSNSGSTLVSTSGNDLLVGTGHSDTFVFAPNFGNDVIKGFVAGGAGHDTIQFSKSVFDSFASVLSHASQVGQDVVISAGVDTLTLKNTKVGALHGYDFHFS
jgi:hypothetical protein